MQPKQSQMKRFLLILMLPMVLSVSLFAQVSGYTITVTRQGNDAGRLADITVTVDDGKPMFTYFLMTNDPVHGKVLQQSEQTGKRKFVFRNVEPGKYFLRIEDGTGIQTGKTVRVEADQDNQR